MNIEIRGVAELNKKLGRIAATDVMVKPTRQSVKAIQRDMAKYPPPRKGSRYIRGYGMEGGKRTSERLGQSWTTSVIHSGTSVTGKAGNKATYAPWVQSRRFQARMHRGRWQTDEKVLKRLTHKILGYFQAAVNKALGGK